MTRDDAAIAQLWERSAATAIRERDAAIAERDRLRADFVRIADAVGLVSTDDAGRIGDVGTVDEVLTAIQRAVRESHAALDSQLAYDEASSERDRLRGELEALRDEMRSHYDVLKPRRAHKIAHNTSCEWADRLDAILSGGES